MTFEELKLCMAIARADLGGGDRTSNAKRLEAASAVMQEFVYLFEDSRFPYTIDDVERWRVTYRKNTETRIKVDVASTHGFRCFWASRNKGPCSEEAECGHLVARSKGGPLNIENCVIECRAHNNQRREMTIEEYLESHLISLHVS